MPRFTRWSIPVALVAALIGATAAALTRSASAAAPEAPVALGVSVSNPGKPSALEDYVSEAGRDPAIVMWFQSFDEPLYYSNQMPAVDSVGAIPMVSWEPAHSGGGTIPLHDIAAGTYDAYLNQAAAAAIAWGKPIFIRFAPEMNLSSNPWGPGVDGNTPADYIAAWRHVVTIFRNAGATNVRWVWSPNVDCGGRCPFGSFYPGDSWVDWVALDGYNYGPVDGSPWMSMAKIFGSSYDEITALTTKPLMIAETASTETGGDKGTWITNSFMSDLPDRLPRVRAVVWFDMVRETDWPIDSSAASEAAYRAVAASPLNAAGAAAVLSQPATTPSSTPSPASTTAASSGKNSTTTPAAKKSSRAKKRAKPKKKHAKPQRTGARWFARWAAWRLHGAKLSRRPAAAPHHIPRWAWVRFRSLHG